jgi:hypothetical protein
MPKMIFNNVKYHDIMLFGTIAFSVAVSGCNSDISVPKGTSIDGCYSNGNVKMALHGGWVIWNNTKVSKYKSGYDQSGSYVLFKPAIHIVRKGKGDEISINRDLSQNYISTIEEQGDAIILMPVEPIDQVKMTRISCN